MVTPNTPALHASTLPEDWVTLCRAMVLYSYNWFGDIPTSFKVRTAGGAEAELPIPSHIVQQLRIEGLIR